MESNDFIKDVLKDINALRSVNQDMLAKMETTKKGFSRMKANDALVKDMTEFLSQMGNAKPVASLSLSRGLSEIAQKQIELFTKGKFSDATINNDLLRERASEFAGGFDKIFQISDSGADTAQDVVNKVVFNKNDKKKDNRRNLLDPDYRQIGLAHAVIKGDNVVVIVLADKASNKTKAKSGDTSELKEAFDLFDVNGIGKIDPKETVAAMRSLGYDTKNPTLFQIMYELDTPQNSKDLVDFDQFVEHINKAVDDTSSEDGIRRIFNLFIDDPSQDTISLATLKKIVRELDENVALEELKGMIERASGSGTELTFQEFYEYMVNKYGKEETTGK